MTGLDFIDFDVVFWSQSSAPPRAAGYVGTVHCSIRRRQAFNYPLALQNHAGCLIAPVYIGIFGGLRVFTVYSQNVFKERILIYAFILAASGAQ